MPEEAVEPVVPVAELPVKEVAEMECQFLYQVLNLTVVPDCLTPEEAVEPVKEVAEVLGVPEATEVPE
jgi:hypothetical protein